MVQYLYLRDLKKKKPVCRKWMGKKIVEPSHWKCRGSLSHCTDHGIKKI